MTKPKLCGDIERTPGIKWVCICPRDNHPLGLGGVLSHRYVNADGDHQDRP